MVNETGNTNNASLEMQDGSPKEKKISRTKIAVTVILGTLVLGFVILGTVLLSGQPAKIVGSGSAEAQRRDIRGIELEEILYGQLVPRGFNGSFVSDSEILYRDEKGDISLYNVNTEETSRLLPGNIPILESALSFDISADRKFLLVAHTAQKLYRYSFIMHYDIFDLTTKANEPLTANDGYRLHLLAQWSPVGNGLVFVAHNNHDIYYKPSVNSPAKRITKTGIPGVIYNGVPDWVYEEEIFNGNKAFWFSRDGRQLAYASFNDSQTRVMSIPFYGLPGNLDFQYTRAVNIRYPKPGTPNPVVKLYVADLEADGVPSKELYPPEELLQREAILAEVQWSTEKDISPIWMNRVQNESYILSCNVRNGICRNILGMKENKGWITLVSKPLFSQNGSKMVLVLPQKQGQYGEFRQVCLGTRGDNGEYNMTVLTSGRITVTEILKYDDKTDTITYLAIDADKPHLQHMYEVSPNIEETKCVTCSVKTKLQKRACNFNTAVFSEAPSSNYVHSCLGPGVPEVTIRNEDHEELLTWENNKRIYEDVRSRQLPIVERFKIKVMDNLYAHVQLMFPPDIDKNLIGKYPMIVNVYGGPDTSQINDKFQIDWGTYLAVNKSYIYAVIDGRGSGNKGNDLIFSIYRRLGTYEVQDQINVTRAIHQKFPFIDQQRTAIWGWSYGGYATAMALAQDRSGVFRCGISVAPVTDWLYYDTIYTERFMGLPKVYDNLEGYARAQVNDKIENIRKKQYYLIHGTMDDNVHYQQSMMLSKALEHADIIFRQQSYTDEEHGLSGVRQHLYHSLENFVNDCFK